MCVTIPLGCQTVRKAEWWMCVVLNRGRGGANMVVRVYVAQKRKIRSETKMAEGTGIREFLNSAPGRYAVAGWYFCRHCAQPLGVPSRMNVGQVFECLLGWAGHNLVCALS